MTTDSYDPSDSGEKLDALLKRIAWLENKVVTGDRAYTQKPEEKLALPLQGKVTVPKPEALAGETFTLEIEMVNFGRTPITLYGMEEIIPCCGMELMSTSEKRLLEGSYLDLKRKILEPSTAEKLTFLVRALTKGRYAIAPRVVYMVGEGAQKILGFNPTIVEVKELVLPGRVSSGYQELDNLLLGGFPEKYAVAFTSVSCDETKLLLNRFVEKGAREGEVTFMITVETRRWEKLAKDFSNVSLFVCNPQAETTMEPLPNVVKIRGVESLTDINIPLFSALRKLKSSEGKPKRICIEILSDILLQHRAAQTRRWLTGLTTELRSNGFTILALINPYMHPTADVHAILDLFDGEIDIYENSNQRFLRVKRMYDQDYIDDELPLRRNKLLTTGVAREFRYHRY